MQVNSPLLIGGADLCRQLSISRTTRGEWVRKGLLPQPVYIVDGGRPRWVLSEVLSAIEARRQS